MKLKIVAKELEISMADSLNDLKNDYPDELDVFVISPKSVFIDDKEIFLEEINHIDYDDIKPQNTPDCFYNKKFVKVTIKNAHLECNIKDFSNLKYTHMLESVPHGHYHCYIFEYSNDILVFDTTDTCEVLYFKNNGDGYEYFEC